MEVESEPLDRSFGAVILAGSSVISWPEEISIVSLFIDAPLTRKFFRDPRRSNRFGVRTPILKSRVVPSTIRDQKIVDFLLSTFLALWQGLGRADFAGLLIQIDPVEGPFFLLWKVEHDVDHDFFDNTS